MLHRELSLIKLLLALTLLTLWGCQSPDQVQQKEQAATAQALARFRTAVQGTLDQLQTDTQSAADAIGATDLSADAIRPLLTQLLQNQPALEAAMFVHPSGVIEWVEPESRRNSEGRDVSHLVHVQRALISQRPMLTPVHRPLEGVYGSLLCMPVRTPEGRFVAVLVSVLKPHDLIAPVAQALLTGSRYEAMVLQPDGRLLYNVDPENVGRNVLVDPSYADLPELRQAVREQVTRSAGQAEFKFQGHERSMRWSSVHLHGTPWRVALVWSNGE